MKFFHVYNEEYFEGLVKNNLINEDTGFKIQHCFAMPKEKKFNRIAAKGGKLYQMIKEGNYPFYVDRIAGGVTYHEYEYDQKLIQSYSELLGDWFLGFQLHESASNRRASDWQRILEKMGSKGPYDAEALKKVLERSYAVTPEGTILSALSQDTPEFYATLRYAETHTAYLEEIKDMFVRRMADVGGHILPCDSYYMATKMQNELGMKTFMPEVGWQIPWMRQAVALARGIAENAGKTWGTYYETWIYREDSGYSMPCYNTEPGNEWYLSQELHPDDFTSYGENGGSSRLLQRRIYYYSLMSGAHYLAEEWGLNCSYSDMNDFTLSSYGLVKKEFIQATREIGRVRALVPFAIVLPKDYSVLELGSYEEDYQLEQYMLSPLSAEEKAYYGHIQKILRLIYAREGKAYGNEGHVMTNSRFGDLFDMIYEDAGDEIFARYACLIDVTKEGTFAAAKAGSGLNILTSRDPEELAASLHRLEEQVLPCRVDGLHWLLSEGENGSRYLSIFNNEGNDRNMQTGDRILSEADRRVKVTLKEAAQLKVVKAFPERVTVEREDDRTWYVTVPAAGMVIFRY